MTDTPAVMMGDYVDLKFMPGLKSARVFVDIPIEHSNTFLKMFDAPDRTNPVKVAIARIQLPAEQSSSDVSRPTDSPDGPDTTSPSSPHHSGKGQDTAGRRFSELPCSQQAALKCQDLDFMDWLVSNHDHDIEPGHHLGEEEYAAAVLRFVLGITSRKELDQMPAKAELWKKMLASYEFKDMER